MTWLLLMAPAAMLLLGFPLFVVLLAISAIVLVSVMSVPLAVVHQVMFGSVDSVVLLAIPFFIFAGEVMSRGGISQRILNIVLGVLGGIRGSLGYATVGTFEVFGAISGSSPATVGALGKLLHAPLVRNGYGERFSIGLITSAGAIAAIIPPSLGMILYGIVAEQSITRLFIAGILPGLLIGAMTAIYIAWFVRRHAIRERTSFDLRGLMAALKDGGWALGTPVLILGGIYAGIFSPTEAAGVAAVYAVLVSRLVYRDLTWRQILDLAGNSALLTGQVLVIVAAAGLFSWILTVNGAPREIASLIQGLDAPEWVVLLAINLLLLAVGCFIDPVSAVLVLTPVLVPIVSAVGVDLVHFGVIMTVNLAIGMFTPPFGLNIFVSQALFRTPLSVMYPALVPFIVIDALALLLVTYVPELSLLLIP